MNKCKQLSVAEKGLAAVRFQARNIALLLALALFVFSSALAQAAQRSDGSDVHTEAEQSLFTKGQTLFNHGLYGEAIVILRQFLESYPNSTIKDLDLLWLGRSYLGQGDLANAEKTGLLLKAIPDTALLSIFEEELRVARQNYLRLAAPGLVRRNEPVQLPAPSLTLNTEKPKTPAPTTAPVIEVATNQAAVQDRNASAQLRRANTTALGPTPKEPGPAQASTNSVLLPRAAIANPTKQPIVQDRRVTNPFAQIRPTSNNALIAPPREAAAAKVISNVDVPSLRLKVEELPRSADGFVSYRLIIVNEGSGVARDLTVREELDGLLEYAASDPLPNRQELVAQKQVLTFRLPAVQAGETKVIQISVRPRRDLTVNIPTQAKHSVIYRDSKGNFLHTP
jgi:hypothetical protein